MNGESRIARKRDVLVHADQDVSERSAMMSECSQSGLPRWIRLEDYLRGIYISEFSTEWERNILSLIPREDRRRHSIFISSVLNEVKKMYAENMKDFILRSILSCKVYKRECIACEECEDHFIIPQRCIVEVGERYDRVIFLRRRSLLADRYFLSNPIVKHVVSTAHRILPAVICDFGCYYEAGMLTLNGFRETVLRDIKRSTSVIANRFYTKTSKAVQRSKVLRNVPAKCLPRLMRCLTNVFVQQILDVMMRSIDHMINTMKDARCCPRIELRLVFDGDRLVIEPSIEDVFSMYHDIVVGIESVARDLMPLEEWLNVRSREKYIKVTLPDWYIEESHRSLQLILDSLFRPVNEHVARISAEFGGVRTSSIARRMSSLISEQTNFEAYLANIREFNGYLSRANAMLSNLYYDVGKLEQSYAKKSLERICCDTVSILTEELVRYHYDFNRSICSDFEELKTVALDIPRDAESLIRLGEYMARASKMLMGEQERKVHRSIRMLSELLDITVLTDEHINLNSATVNWLRDIQPVFAQNNTLCEAMKSEIEEELQRRINVLNVEVDVTFPQLIILDNMDDMNRVDEYVEHYEDLIKKYKCMNDEMRTINSEEKLFKFPETEFPKLTELRETIVPFYTLIRTICQWRRDNSVWQNGPFECLDASVIERKTVRFFEEITEMSKLMKSRIKMDATTSKSYKFAGIADDPDPMQQPAPLKLCWQALADVNKFKVYLPLATCMCNPALEARHWREMSTICDSDLTPNAGTTLRKMINMNLMDNIDKYSAISLGANKELCLQQELTEMVEQWQPVSFEMLSDTESGVVIFRHADSIETLLREHLIKIEEMRSSYFVKPILSDVNDFFAILARIQDCLDQWTHVQFRKLTLESVFSCPGIMTRLNRETTWYLQAKKILLDVKDRFAKDSSFRGIKRSTDLSLILNEANEKLENISRGVRDYLDAKRLSFPRFFFLEDSEIREILFESTDTAKRHTLVKKCFAGIERLKFNRSNCIRCIVGRYGENLPLNNNIPISANVEEQWLIQLEKEMRNAVYENISRYHSSIQDNIMTVSIDDFPSMVIICRLQLNWTFLVEKCFTPLNTATLESLSTTYTSQIISITDELRNNSTQRRRSLLTSLLIVTSVHKEIIQLLLERNVTELTDFEWIAQLRYYHRDWIIEVSMFDATIAYGCEYNHYHQNIVNTPLTDRCFRTMMQAYRYHLYSSIVGPSDAGKTETVRGLAQALAKAFYTVNCNGDVIFECMTRAFQGVIACGAWLCLENFSGLRLELLSAVAQSLTRMQQAISSGVRSVSFEGRELQLNVSGHVCVNINPEQFSYTALPDNLKVLFRFILITMPDVKRITEIELFAGGFLHAKNLAVKLTVTYRLLSEQLGEKSYYCFGASSLKAVVATAINMKQNLPDEDEYTLLMRSMVAVNIPQLRYADMPIFESIMRDCFPETIMLPFDCSTLLRAFEDVCAKRSLTSHLAFKLKAIQIIELMHVRRALVLIGDPLTGKTEILRTLVKALSSLHDEGSKIGAIVKLETVVPGVASNDELFGRFDCDESGGTWKDGMCTAALRRFAEDTTTDRQWLVLDGALSGTWIENLYTALDENATLYLASGERLPVPESTSVIFETTSATGISPGVISRCGIVYIDSHAVNWRSYARSRFTRYDVCSGHDDMLCDLLDWAMDPHLNFLRENDDISAGRELHLVTSMLNLFEMLLNDAYEEAAEEGRDTHFVTWVQAILILAIVWGLGADLLGDSQTRFNTFCTLFWSGMNAEHPRLDVIKHFDIPLPSEGLIQDYFYVFKGVGHWKHWSDLLKSEKILEVRIFDSCHVCIPNVDSAKYGHVFLRHVKHRKPFLIYGDIAVGKSCIVHDLLMNRSPKDCVPNFFSFASMVTVARTQKLLLSKLSKIRRVCYGPGSGRYCVNFVDDVSGATAQRPETQSVFELFRQLLNYGHCYDTEELSKISIQDVTFALAVTAKKIDRNMPLRLLRHFNTYAISAPTTDNIFRIYFNVLLAYLKRNLFTADVTASVTSMVKASIDVYTSVMEALRPIPSKLYYMFDMRDLSRVIDGCGLIQKESVETKTTFIRLWAHEVLRVFGDRMLDENDREWLFLRIRDAVKNNFKDSFEIAFDHLPKFENNRITKDSFDDLTFGNFMNSAERSGKCKRYEEIASVEALRNKVLTYLDEYNVSAKKKMSVVVSRYMLTTLINVSRILSIPGGNVLMISSMGSGRRSTTMLAAFMQQQSLFETTAESYYDMDAWRNNLKGVLRECGASRKDVTYFMNERRMKNAFLSDISCLMSTGELPDLFSVEDRQSIIETTRLHAQSGNRNAELNARSVMIYFANQCKNRLHFVLCFSPTSAAFRTYLCSHPNLAKHCTVNCYQEWPDQALTEIAVKHLRHINAPEEVKINSARACVRFHNDAKEMSSSYRKLFDRTIYVTPSAFLHMLKLYVRLTSKKQNEIIATRNRYLAGLEKLQLAAEQVEQMKATLTVLKPQLELSAQQTVNTMKEVENENITVERATNLVKQEEEVANRKAEIAGILKTECEADLAVAIPILEDAVIALNTLKPTDITLVKAMKNPPDTIKLVMAAVCVMLNVSPDRGIDPVTGKKFTDYWGPSKRILGDMNFLQNLKDYDKDDIEPAVMQVIKKTYMTDNSFMPHIVAKASSAAEGLCKWVRAMVSYDEVAKVVAPKKKKLAAAQTECDEAEEFLNEKRRTLAALNAKLAALHDSLRQTLQKKLNLETEVATCTAKLMKAERLIASLGGEKNHWMKCAHDLQMSYDNLMGDLLLSCGIVAYMAPYNTSFRDEMLIKWQEIMKISKIPYTETYSFMNVLGVEIEINRWQLCGLSKNRFAIENAVILVNSEQWCLFIDPQNQMNQWIKRIERKNNLEVIKPTDLGYMSIIERSIEKGVPVLLENIGESLEVALEPILLKDIYENKIWYIDIGNKSVEYSQNFRLYITTRLSSPNYTADVFSKFTIIDFSMPNGTLRDKLLDIIISKERPELQEQFEALRVQDATNRKVLRQQEENILSILSSTATNILEDENAIRTLDSSKILTMDIMKKQEAARTMTEKINEFRNVYQQFADHCADLFCTLNTLSNLNHMYRFSFSWFIQLYVTSIETSNRSVILEKRLCFLKSSFTRNLHFSVCRSLLEKHKLLYSFLLCVKILIDSGQTTREEVDSFITVDTKDHDAISVEEPPQWLPTSAWKRICKLSVALPNLHGLTDDFLSNGMVWKKYCNAVPFPSHPMPRPWADNLTKFQKLVLVGAIRRDKIVAEMIRLVEDILGKNAFDSHSRFRISESYAESSCLTPIVFLLPSYGSPLSLVSAYASAKGYTSKFISLSMGDKRLNDAEILVERARQDGGWIFLQNCHHVARWLPRLERICESLSMSGTSLDFRLWLSSHSNPNFPISVLQSSVKIAYDYPLRLKYSLLRAYRSEPVCRKEFFEGCPGKDKEFSKLLYGLSFFHGIVRERGSFGPQGWRIPYDFDHADFELSIRQLQNLINSIEGVSFDILLYLVGECNYGGKVIDYFDRRCLRHLLESYDTRASVDDAEHAFSMPQRCEYHDIIAHINGMQLDATPETFAIDENALIARDTALATEFLESMSLLNQMWPLECEDDSWERITQMIDAINSRLPTLFDISELENTHPITRKPLNVVLIREAELINEVVTVIASSLSSLRSALNGDVVMTDSLEDLAREVRDNKVPHVWRLSVDAGIATASLPNYIGLLAKRADFMRSWRDDDPPHNFRFDILSYCRRFLSGVLLAFCRRHNVPIERVTLDLKVKSDDENMHEEDTYYIHGLYLFGARWDAQRHVLIESLTNVFWYVMPPLCLTFTKDERIVDDDVYECPIYVSPTRCHGTHAASNKNYITRALLETEISRVSHWIKRGAALFCQVDE